ncbi:hypothetical protein Pint_24131 [Pistacia integerrima]|uniref:Uncharacterized protein n=1 Tax=Pistacia integerrima TaxID=434235 RepID=A0ACC0YLF3_9ROSI|nr:hypothetical protein Pint_24131 [Pistacia integerrima]
MECSSAGKGNGEVRRLHIVYFLSRMGRIEHPHLIRVHHLTRNGVYLRDVKRWLADVRGKDMPDAFAWSYKRRYKSGYVWQDLLDDDLITPISDNEYVLKGSETIPSSPFDPCSYIEKRSSSIFRNDDQDQPSPKEEIQDSTVLNSPTQTSSEIYQDLPLFGSERSTLTDDSLLKLDEEDKTKQRETCENYSSFYSSLLNKKKTKNKTTNNTNNNDIEKMGKPGSLFSSSRPSFAKSKSYSNGASNMFRNLIKCGAVETNDSVLVSVNRADKSCSTKSTNTNHPDTRAAAICQVERIGGSARIFGTPWNNQHNQQYSYRKSFDGVRSSKKKHKEFAGPKPVSAAYKPVGGPTCSASRILLCLGSLNNVNCKIIEYFSLVTSDLMRVGQCGKLFKPEKLHTHMKSCKGMKAIAKTAAVSVEMTPSHSQRSINVNLSNEESTSASLLTRTEF